MSPEMKALVDEIMARPIDYYEKKPPPKPALSAAEHNKQQRALSARERMEQQQADMPRVMFERLVEQTVEMNLAAQRRLAAEDRATCNIGRGDPDFDPSSERDPLKIWRRV